MVWCTYCCEKNILTMMVNNSTNINKTNIHLSPQLTEHKKGGDMTYDVGNPDPGFGQAQKYGRVKCICDKVA